MDDLGVLIPILAISIPLVAVAGRVIVQPIVQAMLRMTETQERMAASQGTEQRLARMEAQLELMERNVARVVEVQEFQARLLEAPQAAPGDPAPR